MLVPVPDGSEGKTVYIYACQPEAPKQHDGTFSDTALALGVIYVKTRGSTTAAWNKEAILRRKGTGPGIATTGAADGYGRGGGRRRQPDW